jgi:hypothetical protein
LLPPELAPDALLIAGLLLIMPESFPPTELMGACVLSLLEQPASQNPTNETAAIRRNLNTGLPVLINPPLTAIL